jgi:DNA ligase D-like protein (predicted 3'-phosphoesterase)
VVSRNAAAGSDALATYRSKRNLRRSGEPAGAARAARSREPKFVVQQHRATGDHYDFRLEVDGVLKSWAVPKGPSVDPRDKRMARPTEDHPLEYAGFEGVIPAGEYGAGPVQVWDHGSYRNRTEQRGQPVSMAEAITRGHVSFELDGRKLHGGFALTRIRSGKGESWLLVKKDKHARSRGQPVRTRRESTLSGRSIEEIAAGARSARNAKSRR